jgi:hypothetical protein
MQPIELGSSVGALQYAQPATGDKPRRWLHEKMAGCVGSSPVATKTLFWTFWLLRNDGAKVWKRPHQNKWAGLFLGSIRAGISEKTQQHKDAGFWI